MALKPGSGGGGGPAELMRSAVRLYETGDYERARKTARKLLSAAPGHPDVTHLLGAIALAEGRFREAIDDFNRSLKANPRQPAVHNNMGEAHRRLGENEKAAACYEAAIRLDGRNAGFRNNLGVALRDLGRPEDALAMLDEALRLEPGNAAAEVNRATVLHILARSQEAIDSYRRILVRAPRNTEALNNLGSTLNDLGRFEEAIDHFRKVMAINPRHTGAHCSIAVSLLKLGRGHEAIRHLELAKSIAPGDASILNQLGNTLRDMGRIEEALANLEESVRRDPTSHKMLCQLANGYRSAGEDDQAEKTYRQVLARDPLATDCYRLLAEFKPYPLDGPDVAAMKRLYEDPAALDDERRMHLAFALGKVHEGARAFAQAFDYFLEGNRLQRARYAYDHAETEAEFQRIEQVFSRTRLEQLAAAGAGHPDAAPIFILGMPRSGTTLVEQILASHSDVFGAGELYDMQDIASIEQVRTTRTYPDCFADAAPARFDELGREYVRRVREIAGTAPRFTDKMPHNFRYVGLIRAMLPNARIIHCRREPADNCLSIFKNFFTDAHRYATDLADLGRYYLAYRDLMAHWEAIAPAAIHTVQYEEMVADQEGQSRRLLEYCGLAWEDRVLDFHETERMVNTISVSQVRRPIYTTSVKLSERYGERLRHLLEHLEPGR